MKKIISGLLFMLMSLGLVTAGDIGSEDVLQKSTCNPSQSENVNFYLTSDGVLTQPFDTFKSSNSTDLLIGNNSSSVEIWRHGIISGCTGWNRSSLVAKGGDTNKALVIINDGDCHFNIPTDPNYVSRKINNPTAIDTQIHFTIGYKTLSSTWNSNHPKANKLQSRLYYKYSVGGDWRCLKPNGTTGIDNCSTITRYYSDQTYSHTGECRNYRIFWCGDGLVNGRNSNGSVSINYDNDKDENGTYLHSYTEQCDPNDPNRIGWNNNGKTCNPNTCQLEAMPAQCSSDYNTEYYTLHYTGQWLYPNTPGLCSGGSSTSFRTDPSQIPQSPTSPIQYFWSCTTGGITTTGCNAVQMRCGDGEIQREYREECEPGLPIVFSGLGEESNSMPQGRDLSVIKQTILSLNHLNTSDSASQSASTSTSQSTSITSTQSNLSSYAQNIQEEIMSTQTATYSCNSLCKIIPTPQCSSQYNGTGLYTSNSSGQAIFPRIQNLCSGGLVTGFNASQTIPGGRSYSWGCTTGGITTTGCNAYQNWCGDGIVNGNEICDPNDTTVMSGWGGGGCSNTCEPIESASCNSQLSGIYYSPNYAYLLNWLISQNLCAVGTATNIQTIPQISQNMIPTSPIQYKWSCENGTTSENCSLNQNWCGDGQINGDEVCDDGVLNGQPGHCNNKCERIISPLCVSSYNGSGVYTGGSNPVLNSGMDLCSGGVVTNFQISEETPRYFTWDCETTGLVSNGDTGKVKSTEITVTTTGCNFKQIWCGDGQIQSNHGEKCDDGALNGQPGHCSTKCDKILPEESKCNSTYDGKTEYTTTSGLWLNSGMDLCEMGEVTNFAYTGTPRQYTWTCNNEGNTTGCSASQIWCGDGKINGEEKCDPEDPKHTDWGNGGCDAACHKITVAAPVCSSNYNGQRLANLTGGNHLCSEGTYSDFDYNESTHKWTWKCNNTAGSGENCTATKKYCGDGIKDEGEQCDPEDPKHTNWGNGGCDAACHKITVAAPVCSSNYNGQRLADLTGGNHLCSEGTYSDFDYNESTHKWTWKCNNTAGSGENCTATKKYCGDGIKDEGEQCDPEDPKHTDWGNGGCDAACHKITVAAPVCSSNYNGQRLANLTGGNHLCSEGTYSDFDYNESTHKWTWKCNNTAGSGENCTATKKYCGDGIKDEGEQCDPALLSSIQSGYTCNSSCQLVKNPTTGHLVIEKSSVGSGKITNSGDIITWKIRVTAVAGDVTNPVIWDSLPPILGYKESHISPNTNSLGLSISNPAIESGNEVWWYVTGTLTQGNSIEIQLDTYAKRMPNKDDTYKNVACVRYNADDEEIICDDEPIHAPHLRIKKTFVGGNTTNKIVNAGDTIVYKISFGNTGDAPATITSIRDYVPNTVKYITSSISINGSAHENIAQWNGTLHNGHRVEGLYLDIFTGITLNPGERGDIILTGRVLTGTNQDYRTNFACIYLNGNKINCDDVTHEYRLMCKVPEIETESFSYTGGSTEVICKTDPIGSIANLIELDCGNGTIKSGTNISQLTGTCKYPENNSGQVQRYEVKCMVNGSGDGCNGVVRVKTGSANSVMCKAPRIETELFSYTGGTTTVTCGTNPEGEKADSIELDCGNGTIKSGTNISQLTGTCKYPENNSGQVQRYEVKCTVNGSGDGCNGVVRVKTGSANSVMCTAPVIEKPTFTNEGGRTTVTCKASPEGEKADLIEIDCGYNGQVISGTSVSELSGICEYPKNIYSIEKTYPVKCRVNGSGGEICNGEVSVATGDVSCKPTLDPQTFSSVYCSNTSQFSTTVTCNSTIGEADLEIICDGETIKTGHAEQIIGTCSGEENNRDYKVQCKINGSLALTGERCESSFRRNCSNGPSCFPAGTKVSMADGTQKNIEDVQIGESVVSYNTYTNENEKSIVKETFVHTDNLHEMYELTINGDVLKVTDIHPFYVRKSEFSKDYDWIEARDLKVGDILLMSDGSLVNIQKIDHYSNKETVYNLEVEGNHNYFVDKGYLVHNKCIGQCCGEEEHCSPTPYCEEHKDDPICNTVNPRCHNINAGNFSIESGEYLPYYLNIRQYKDSPYKYVSVEDDNVECTPLTINLGSLECKYIIRDPKNNVVYEKNDKCLDNIDERYPHDNLIKKRLDKQSEWYGIYLEDLGGTYWPKVGYTDSKKWNTKGFFGEYKFQIEVRDYEWCKDGKRKPEHISEDDAAVCQSNFVFTDPYTVQKTPSGNLTASTKNLGNFKKANGSGVFSDYLSTISTSDYAPSKNVDDAMDAFIQKYEKLAVNIYAKDKFGKDVTVKKVSGNDIYFLNGSAIIKGSKVTKPLTIMHTSGDITIIGNLDHNVMVLTKGDIIFSGDCNSDQTVKGIFYAKGHLNRTGVKKNNNLSNNVWCTKGGLNVKGVLIGNNFTSLMNNSRSHLEDWFKKEKYEEKRKSIINGASVLIEYSPSIFNKSTMPPGAEDFATALSVYKQ